MKILPKSDVKLIYEWYKDPVTRSMSVNKECVPWSVFFQKFREFEKEAFIKPRIYIMNNTKVAYISYSIIDDIPEININIAPSERGKGYGSFLIGISVEIVFKETFFEKVRARIKQENLPSIIAFTKAGFKYVKKDKDGLKIFEKERENGLHYR